jgi:nucleoid DNA-binding protein
MAQDKREPKQRLPKTGEEIPVPKRADVLRDLRKGLKRFSVPRRPKK